MDAGVIDYTIDLLLLYAIGVKLGDKPVIDSKQITYFYVRN
jgi:hypothetical protein